MINMADREDLQTPFDRQRAVSLLEEATQFLREYSGGSAVSTQSRSGENFEIQPVGSRRNEPHSSQTLQANHTRFPHTSTTTASSAFTNQNRQGNEDNILSGSLARNSAANGRVLDNFRSLFSPYGRETSSTSSSSVQSPSASKRRKRNTFFFKRETWTHEFFCLADKDQMVVPSRSLKIQLQEAGLGRKKICLDGRADATEVKTTLEESYPKLKEGGGFEILRRGPSPSELTLIPPPPSGYTVKFLRDSAGLGQAIAFVRPLQCNLNREAIKPVSDHSQDSGSVPKVACINCSLEIPVTLVRQHLAVCCNDDDLPDIARRDETRSTESISQAPVLLSFPSSSTSDVHATFSNNLSGEEFITSTAHPLPLDPVAVRELQILFPDKDEESLRDALSMCEGNYSLAASRLVNWDENHTSSSSYVIDESKDDGNHRDLMQSAFSLNYLTNSDEDLQSIMGKHRQQLDSQECNRLSVDREQFWEDCVVFFKNPKFNPRYPLRIRFAGEAGLDAGGLRREFGSLLISKLFSSEAMLFEGSDDRKVPVYNADAVHSNLFHLAGKICAYLLSHLDLGVSCISPVIYSYITTDEVHEASKQCTLEDIPDYDLRKFIEEVNNASSNDELQRVLDGNAQTDALLAAGWVRVLTVENKGLAMWQLMIHEVILKRKVALDQFCAGLKVLGVRELLIAHSKMMEPYFVAREQTPLSANAVLGLFEDISQQQSDVKKEQARQHLIKAITDLDVEDSKTDLQHFLHFLTGLYRIPPLGLETHLTITYKEDTSKTLHAETCAYNLNVPTVHDTYEEFQHYFLLTCRVGYVGFGLV